MGLVEIQPERPTEMRRYKVTYRRKQTGQTQTNVVLSKHIGKSAAFNDALQQATAMAPGSSWSVELLEVDTDAYRVEAIKVMSIREIIMDEEAKYCSMVRQDIDPAEYLPALVMRIKQIECEVEA